MGEGAREREREREGEDGEGKGEEDGEGQRVFKGDISITVAVIVKIYGHVLLVTYLYCHCIHS